MVPFLGEQPQEPPPEPSTFECDDCGSREELGDAHDLAGGRYCLRCAAAHAVTVLDHNGPTLVTVGDIEAAAEVLHAYSKIGKARRLAGFSGVVQGGRHG